MFVCTFVFVFLCSCIFAFTFETAQGHPEFGAAIEQALLDLKLNKGLITQQEYEEASARVALKDDSGVHILMKKYPSKLFLIIIFRSLRSACFRMAQIQIN